MIHPSTQLRYIDGQFDYGLFAVEFIPRGTVVWAQDHFDQAFASSQVDSLAKPHQRILEKYAFASREGSLLLCWDARRFLNHSCAPNILMTRYGFEIAVNDIRPGDQITCDYSALSLKRPFSCHCRKPECRGIVHPEDAMLCAAGWAHETAAALRMVNSVDQPLWHLIDGEGLLLDLAKEPAPQLSRSIHLERNAERALQPA